MNNVRPNCQYKSNVNFKNMAVIVKKSNDKIKILAFISTY